MCLLLRDYWLRECDILLDVAVSSVIAFNFPSKLTICGAKTII